jgi:hypothetical protein
MATKSDMDIQEIKRILAASAKPAWEPADVLNVRAVMAMVKVIPALVALIEQLQARVEQLERDKEA